MLLTKIIDIEPYFLDLFVNVTGVHFFEIQ